MTIQATYTERDYLRSQYLHLRSRILPMALLGLAVGLLLIGFFLSPPWHRAWFALWVLGALAGYVLILLFVIIPWRVRRLFRQQKLLHETYEMEITAEGFTNSSRRGRASFTWGDFHKFRAAKEITLLYQSDNMFHMFPRRCFTEEQYAEFQGYLKAAFKRPI